MSNTARKRRAALAVLLSLSLTLTPRVSCQQDTEYRRFRFDDADCDVGVRYKNTDKGLTIGVSALATGKGASFRKWNVTKIKIRIGNDRISPDKDAKFYVTEKNYFKVPAAIIFAAIGAFGEYGGSDLNNTMSKIGVSLGLFFIAMAAEGEITGQRCVFYIPKDVVSRIEEGKDNIEIDIANDDEHLNESVRIGLVVPTIDTEKSYKFESMTADELSFRMDSLKSSISALEAEQSAYKYGLDPQFNVIQRKIETLETERGLAYKAWFEKKNGPSN
jgi:hypothetical protein